MRALIPALALAFTLSACATAPPLPVNIAASGPPPSTDIATHGEQDVLFLALSGGGARAAAFALGALQQLRDTPAADGRPLTDHVALITAVSGGSISAAYYGRFGAPGLDTFRAAYLDKNWATALNTNPIMPLNWSRAWSGGVNGPDRLADWLDREVLAGAHMRDLQAGPQIWLNAADLYHGVPFSFAPLYFNAICADLSAVRVGDAVAASMAVPVVFRPVLIEPHPEACAPPPPWIEAARGDRAMPALARASARAFAAYRDPAQLRYVHLVDGGLIDNLGLSALTLTRLTAAAPHAPLSQRDAARLRRLTMLIVNAEMTRDADWQMRATGPNGAQIIDTAYDVSVEAANRAAYDSFRAALAHWRTELIAWRCALPAREARALTQGIADWACADLTLDADMISFADFDPVQRDRLGHVATRVSLPAADIDAAIAGGRAATAMNEAARAFARP